MDLQRTRVLNRHTVILNTVDGERRQGLLKMFIQVNAEKSNRVNPESFTYPPLGQMCSQPGFVSGANNGCGQYMQKPFAYIRGSKEKPSLC